MIRHCQSPGYYKSLLASEILPNAVPRRSTKTEVSGGKAERKLKTDAPPEQTGVSVASLGDQFGTPKVPSCKPSTTVQLQHAVIAKCFSAKS